MKFYKCDNFESLIYTKNRRYQDKESMIFAYSDISDINISHCYISSPKGKYFFNLDLHENLTKHTDGIHELLSAKEKCILSRTLKRYFGRSLDKFGLGLFGSDQIHFFARPNIILRVAEYFTLQETMLGDLSFCYEWSEQDTKIRRMIGDYRSGNPKSFYDILLVLENADDWRDVIEERDWLFLWLWLNNCSHPHGEVTEAHLIELRILKRLKWLRFYHHLTNPLCYVQTETTLSAEYGALAQELKLEFENMYPFLSWEFPLS